MPELARVLLVDDEGEIVAFMENFLKRLGISSVKATSGEEAMELYDSETIDFVFLDIHMKAMDGFTVLERLKDINPKVKVVIIAGSSEKESIERAKRLGALDYITKPLDLSDFKKKIDRYVLGNAR